MKGRRIIQFTKLGIVLTLGILFLVTYTSFSNDTSPLSDSIFQENIALASHCVSYAGGFCFGVDSCGQIALGEVLCDGSCSADGAACGCVAISGWDCPASNSCGQTNYGVYDCGGTCDAVAPPESDCVVCDANEGSSCSASSACDTNYGTIQCDGSCSATTPSLPSGYGTECFSGTNSCGQLNVGSIQCDGTCSVSTPPDSQCGSCSPGNQCLYDGIYYGGPNYCCGDEVCNILWTCGSDWQCNTQNPLNEKVHTSSGPTCGCSGGSYIAPPANYGDSCESDANICGSTNPGTIQCDGTCSSVKPPDPSFTACTSPTNICGDPQGQWQCDSSECVAVDPPLTNCSNACGGTWQCDSSECTPDPPGYGTPCNSEANICGETVDGTKQCDGTCSADAPPLPGGYGDFCESAPNSCGMTNIGAIDCSAGCSASTPSDSLCNNPPAAVTNLVVQGDECGAATPSVIVSWTFTDPDSSDTQTAYHIRIYREGSVVHNSGQIQSSSQQYAPPLGTFLYGVVYTWELKVWDSGNPPSNSNWIDGTGFVTPSHQYPTPTFTWSPDIPGEDEAVSFTDTSTAYGGSSIISWAWTFEDGTPASSLQQNPVALFSSIGSKSITLEVTDSDGFSCTDSSQSVGIGVPFPEWEEIPPFGIELVDYFAGLFTK